MKNGRDIRLNGKNFGTTRFAGPNFHFRTERDSGNWYLLYTGRFSGRRSYSFRRRPEWERRWRRFFRRYELWGKSWGRKFSTWPPRRSRGQSQSRHLTHCAAQDCVIKSSRWLRKKKSVFVIHRNAIQKRVRTQKGIMTGWMMRFLTWSVIQKNWQGKCWKNRRRNFRSVRLRWVWILRFG